MGIKRQFTVKQDAPDLRDYTYRGIVPMPNRRKEKKLGGHALLAVGYEDGDKHVQGRIIARNSWGSNWGDKGYCYLPYGFFKSLSLTFVYWTGH